MKLLQVNLSCKEKITRRSMLACTAACAVASVIGVAASRRSTLDAGTQKRTWLSVSELVGWDDKASDLARRLAGSRVEVRGYEFVSNSRNGDFDLHHRLPVPCGSCGFMHAPGATLRVVGAGRNPVPLRRSTFAGRLEISSDARMHLAVDTSVRPA